MVSSSNLPSLDQTAKKPSNTSALVHGLLYGHAEVSVLSASGGHLDFLSKFLKFLQGFQSFFQPAD